MLRCVWWSCHTDRTGWWHHREVQTFPGTVLRLMQSLESLTHRHEDGSLHSELASRSGGAVGWGMGVVTGGEGCSHCMVHIGDSLHDACCQCCYVQYGSHLKRAATSWPYDYIRSWPYDYIRNWPYDCIRSWPYDCIRRRHVENQNSCKQAHTQLFGESQPTKSPILWADISR